ncbi:MAG: hypothetical protein JO228_06785 [Xanthobacteraceae bacterium]|nr:hypothetical protein [Xanthobacteraceae bacterium]
MSRKGLEGQTRGSILVQLGASAGVLVLPPLMMSAGVALFGTQTEDRLQIAADQTVASAVSKSSALIPLSPRPREVPKSTDRPPQHEESLAETSDVATVTAGPAVEVEETPNEMDTEVAAEPAPFLGPIPVTLVVVRKEPEPEEAEAEEAEPEPAASPSAPVRESPHTTPPPVHVAHSHGKADREDARVTHRTAERHPHAPAAAQHAASAAPHAHASAPHLPAASAPHHVAASAPKAKPRSPLQHRADLDN